MVEGLGQEDVQPEGQDANDGQGCGTLAETAEGTRVAAAARMRPAVVTADAGVERTMARISGPQPEAESENVVPTGVTTAPPEKIGTFASLRLRNFRILLFGTTLSNVAQWIQQVTLNWLVYDLTGSGTALGTINLVRGMSSLGLAPAAGLAIDRLGRRFLLVAINGWLFVISAALGIVIMTGHVEVWHLFVFSFLGGVAMTFDMPLRQTVTFDLVPRVLAPNAVALIQTGWSLMRSVGPILGGFLILWFGAGGNFLVQAVVYTLIALSVLWIRFPRKRSDARPRGNAFANIGEGLKYVAKERMTRTFTLMGLILPLLIIPTFAALPPIYAKDVFHGGPDTLGYLMASVGVGGIIGGVFIASLGRFERRGLVQLGALLGVSLALIAFALSPNLWMALPVLAVAGVFEMIYLTTNQTLLQLSIPDEMRGRVTSIVSLNFAIFPVGSFVAGAGSDLIGPRAITTIMCIAAVVVACAVFLFSPTVRDYRLSEAFASSAARSHGGSA